MAMIEYVRIALTTQLTRSVVVHNIVTLASFPLPAAFLAAILIAAALRHPERAWLHLGFAVLGFVVWYLAGESTRLVRRDSDGAEPGFMFFAAMVTYPVGVLAALLT